MAKTCKPPRRRRKGRKFLFTGFTHKCPSLLTLRERLDEAKSMLDQLQNRKKRSAVQIKEYEDRRDRAENPTERKQLDDLISNLKSEMQVLAPGEQEAQAKEMELAEQLRIEQGELELLENELDRLDRSIMSAALPLVTRNR